MRISRPAVVATALTVGISLVAIDTATYAATGDSLILGRFNKAHKTTHITNTGNGPALSLHAKGKRPALAVDSNTKIVRLNSDRVDGKHAAALQNNVRVFTRAAATSTGGAITFKLPNFPKGRYQATYSVYLADLVGTPASPVFAECYLGRAGSPSAFAGYTSTNAPNRVAGLSGSDIVNKNSSRWYLYCFAETQEWAAGTTGLPVRVTLTRVDKTIGGRLSTARTSQPQTAIPR